MNLTKTCISKDRGPAFALSYGAASEDEDEDERKVDQFGPYLPNNQRKADSSPKVVERLW
jgi:hypothetical protein